MILKDKVILVHGAAGAVGSAMSRAFAREGARLFLAGRSMDRLDPLARELGAEAHQVDALSESDVETHADLVLSKAGRIDGTVNAMNPDPVQGVSITEIAAADFLNPVVRWTTSQFLTARSAAKRMIPRRSGVILTLSASPARLAIAGTGGFATACAAIEGLTRSLAAELGPHHVRAVGLRAQRIGDTLEEASDLPMPPAEFRRFLEGLTLIKELPSLTQVAETAAFLMSDRAGAITGAIANLTCGMDVD